MLKRFFKQNSHNFIFKALAGLGRSINRFYENRNHDIYSNGELRLIKILSDLKPKVIIDGGANIGKYSKVIHKHVPGCTIYSFEPVKDTFEKLKDNVKDCEGIFTINKGLYLDNCTKQINLFNSDTHSSIYDIKGLNYKVENTTEIELISGDDFINEHKIDHIDLLKLDLEGAEYDALLGFEECLRKGIIKIIQFEYGYINITTKKLLIDFYELFSKHGYVVGKVFPKCVEFRNYEFKYEDFLGPNFIAVKRSEVKLINVLAGN